MPLIRRAQGKDVQFSVSPWQVKQTLSQPEGEQIYQETLLPYKPDQPLIPAAAAETKQTVKAKARPHAFEGGWQTRKKPTPLDNLQPATAVNSLLPGSNQKQTSETDPDEQETSQHQQPGTIFEGTAVLAFLQNGQLSGHFIDKQSKQCFGVMGLQLTALRECTRDTEWKLLKITIVDFASKAEVQFAAERTAADAARMQAPLQFHGDEPELAEALQGLAPNNVELHFDCHTIMDGDAADACLRAFNPKLLGQGAVVNKGDMQIKGLRQLSRQRQMPSSHQQQVPVSSGAYDSDFDD